jgi:hypothetical protein
MPRNNDELDSTSRLHALRQKQFEDICESAVYGGRFDDDLPRVLSFSFPFRLNTDFFPFFCTNNTNTNDDDLEASAKEE